MQFLSLEEFLQFFVVAQRYLAVINLLSHLPNREEELAQILYSKAFDYLYDRLM
jgi:hypothetical protein